MKLEDAQALAYKLMTKHGLFDEGWEFKWEKGTKVFGRCCWDKTIKLSKPLVQVNEKPAVKDTILHEIAHALVGIHHGHDGVWQAMAIAIGCNGKATCQHDVDGVKGYYPWKLVCKRCGREWLRRKHQTGRSWACSQCSKELSGKTFSKKALLVWEPTDQWQGPSPRPQSGVTLKVWQVADALLAKLGRVPSRFEVVSECFNEHGIRLGTIKVQYSKWVKSLTIEKGVDFLELSN